MRRLFVILGALVSASVLAPAAIGVPPDRFVNLRFDGTVTELDEFLSAECGFPIFSTGRGHFSITVYFNQDGSIKRFVQHPSFTNILSSQWATIETSDRGVDKVTQNPDGTLTVHGTGIHFRLKGEAYAIGLWRLTIEPETGELLSAEYHGNFGLEEPDIVPFICARLGPAT